MHPASPSARLRAACRALLIVVASALVAFPTTASTASAPPTAATPATTPAAPTIPAGWRYRTVEGAGGVPLNVVEAGDPANPGILLIHGLAQSHLAFEHQLNSALAERFHLVSFDLRGHGHSGKPWLQAAYSDTKLWAEDVARVIAATGLVRPVIVGWSYGTLVATDYLAVAGPGAIAGLVTAGAYGGLTPPPPTAAIAAEMQRVRERQLSPNLDVNWATARQTATRLTAKPMPPAWLERAAAISMMLPRTAREGMFTRSFDRRGLIPGLKDVPVLLVVGGKDGSTPEAAGRELAAQLRKARVSVYPEDGHTPFVESPERFDRELAEFAKAAHGR